MSAPTSKQCHPSVKDNEMATQTMTSKPNIFSRFWRWLELASEALDVTETSKLAERVVALEREVAALRTQRGIDRIDVPNSAQ